jgi:hypothetical protein
MQRSFITRRLLCLPRRFLAHSPKAYLPLSRRRRTADPHRLHPQWRQGNTVFLIIHRTGGLWAGVLPRQHIPSKLLSIMLRRSSDTMEMRRYHHLLHHTHLHIIRPRHHEIHTVRSARLLQSLLTQHRRISHTEQTSTTTPRNIIDALLLARALCL